MSGYVDGFVLTVAEDRLEEYRRITEEASSIFIEYGALEYRECVADDLEMEGVCHFRDCADARDGEVVLFSYVTYASREARDTANEKIAKDPRMIKMMDNDDPVFDVKRMAFGGFRTLMYAAAD